MYYTRSQLDDVCNTIRVYMANRELPTVDQSLMEGLIETLNEIGKEAEDTRLAIFGLISP